MQMRQASRSFWEVDPLDIHTVIITKDGAEFRGRQAREFIENSKLENDGFVAVEPTIKEVAWFAIYFIFLSTPFIGLFVAVVLWLLSK